MRIVSSRLIALALLLAVALAACSTLDVNRKRADRYFEQGLYNRAWEKYQQVLDEGEPSFDLYYSLGRTAVQLQKWDKCTEYFEEARALDTSFPDTYEQLAYCYRKQGEKQKVEDTWRALLRHHPDHPKAHVALAGIHFDREEYEQAELHYRKFLEKDPDNVMIRSSLAAALIARKKYQAAISQARQALSGDPKCVLCHFNLGVAYLGANENAKAVREFIVVTGIEPANQDGWVYLAATYCRLGQPLSAIETLQDATEYGFADWARIDGDKDFTAIHNDPRYQDLKRKHGAAAAAAEAAASEPAAEAAAADPPAATAEPAPAAEPVSPPSGDDVP